MHKSAPARMATLLMSAIHGAVPAPSQPFSCPRPPRPTCACLAPPHTGSWGFRWCTGGQLHGVATATRPCKPGGHQEQLLTPCSCASGRHAGLQPGLALCHHHAHCYAVPQVFGHRSAANARARAWGWGTPSPSAMHALIGNLPPPPPHPSRHHHIAHEIERGPPCGPRHTCARRNKLVLICTHMYTSCCII